MGNSYLRSFLVVTALICASTSAVKPSVNNSQPSQTSATSDRAGIELYEKGDFVAAIKALKAAVKQNKADLTAWHYLGLAFERLGNKSDARKAHEQAAKTADRLLISPFDQHVALSRTQLLEAADSADHYLALSANPSKKKKEEWHDRAEFLRVFIPDIDPSVRAYSGKELTTRPRVLSKPEPQYTEAARQHQITGTVVLRCIFAEDGRVRNIVPIQGLRYGLTRKAINAAYQIKFIPATKDGQPVSMYMQLEYNFNLY
jgi:TonB family protein